MVKQDCQLRPAPFGLYVDGLEKPMPETADIDLPMHGSVILPLLYSDDLILM